MATNDSELPGLDLGVISQEPIIAVLKVNGNG